jgi:hypothetical protein
MVLLDLLDTQVVPDRLEQQAQTVTMDLPVVLATLVAQVLDLPVAKAPKVRTALLEVRDIQVVDLQDLLVSAPLDTQEVSEQAIQDRLVMAEALAHKVGQVVGVQKDMQVVKELDTVQIKPLQQPAVLDLKMCI